MKLYKKLFYILPLLVASCDPNENNEVDYDMELDEEDFDSDSDLVELVDSKKMKRKRCRILVRQIINRKKFILKINL